MAEQSGHATRGDRDLTRFSGAGLAARNDEACAPPSSNRLNGNCSANAGDVAKRVGGAGDVEEGRDHSSVDSGAAAPDNRPPSVRRKFRTLTFGRRCKTKVKVKEGGAKKRSKGAPWNFKFNYRLKRAGASGCSASDIPEPGAGCGACVCTGYRRTEEHHLGAGVVFQASSSTAPPAAAAPTPARSSAAPVIDLLKFNPDDYPIDDWEERARAERARELEEGVDPPPGYRPTSPTGRLGTEELRLSDLAAAFQSRLTVGARYSPRYAWRPACGSGGGGRSEEEEPALSTETHLISQFAHVTSQGACIQRTVHTQVDYIHCLVPDLRQITDCGFYWGKMDRYEAEKLLESKAEGTFLLRDSAQEEYLFSVSFRRYGRSLHARIEQWNHRFSFDSHDPGVFASETVCGLIEHYKDPSCCMFFEPMLTIPLHRTFPFPLQHLCRSAICAATSYDGVNRLRLPKSLKAYLKEYHYKQRVRVRRFEVEH